jgi:protein CMS1
MSSEDNLQEPLIERLSASPDPESSAKTPSKKRKRGSEDAPKKSKSKKSKAQDEDELDIEAGINRAFSHMDNQLLADYVAQRTRKYESDLSMIELEDKYLPGMADI